jgi:hypothetical protein
MKRLLYWSGAALFLAYAAKKFGPDVRRELKIYSMS